MKDYLTNVRMEKAKILLKNTDLQIREISEKAGYPDPLHFSRAFRDWCGMSPSQYRHSLATPDS